MRDGLAVLDPEPEVVLVTFSTPDRARRHRTRLDLPFPVLVDPDRATYRAYGLDRGTVGRVWGPKTVRRYRDIIRVDGIAGLRPPDGDTLQLGGDFVVARDGTLAWGFWSDGPDDRPAIGDLKGAVAAASA